MLCEDLDSKSVQGTNFGSGCKDIILEANIKIKSLDVSSHQCS